MNTEYQSHQARIKELDQEINKINAKSQSLEQEKTECLSLIQETQQALDNAGQALAKGEMSTDDYVLLQPTLIANESKLKILTASITEHAKATMLLDNERDLERRKLMNLRADMANEISSKSTEVILSKAGEELKALIHSEVVQMVRNGKIPIRNEDYSLVVFAKLGKRLCTSIFSDQHFAPDIFESGPFIDQLIAKSLD